MPDARCSWSWPNTTPWLPLDRHWPWPRARLSESYTAAAADTTTSTPAASTTRTCCESRQPSCNDTPRCPTTDRIPPHLHHLPTTDRPLLTTMRHRLRAPPSRARDIRADQESRPGWCGVGSTLDCMPQPASLSHESLQFLGVGDG